MYNYHAYDTITGKETAWGTFNTRKMDIYELRERAKNLAYAFFFNHDVRVDIYEADETSGDFNDLYLITSYTTHEN